MALHLYNTLSGKKEPLRKSARIVKMFVCGPTVNGSAHIGHARVDIVFDVFARYLRDAGYTLIYVQNITDVDDKIINRAREEGVTAEVIARRYEKEYLACMKILRITSVDRWARTSDFIPEIIRQIIHLVMKGFAYRAVNGVYFEVRKFAKYGALSRQDLDALRPGWRIEPDPDKKDPLDFALWKFSDFSDEVSWQSPWGRGRPGWHIEDTAITEKLLGQQYDIHGGGIDLKFPHHESEIAQQEAASGKKPLVKIWMHVGMVTIGDVKMSKSLRNSVDVVEFLEKYPVNVLRFMFMGAQYRSPMNYTDELAEQAVSALTTLAAFLARVDLVVARGTTREPSPRTLSAWLTSHERAFVGMMEDDFNTPGALAALFTFVNGCEKRLWQMSRGEAVAARNFVVKRLALFGIIIKKTPIPPLVMALAKKREVFRVAEEFTSADRIRQEIETAGYIVHDTPFGPLVRHQRGF